MILKRILLFLVLPILAVLSFPPQSLVNSFEILLFAMAFFLLLGVFLWRGRSLALTFAIFLQGMNVIVRLMLFLSNTVSRSGEVNAPLAVALLIGLALSLYLLLRLDQNDIRSMMTA